MRGRVHIEYLPRYGRKKVEYSRKAHYCTVISKGKKQRKEKHGYDTELEAVNVARQMNCDERNEYKVVAYRCLVCGKWHVGHTNHYITHEQRLKYKERLIKNIEYVRNKIHT